MITVDARGLFCPAPVVEARMAIDSLPKEGGQVRVFVDNQLAVENLGRMADASGYGHLLSDQEDGVYSITITVGTGRALPDNTAPTLTPSLPPTGTGLAVAIGRAAMGDGDKDLGEILIKGFLYTLSQLPDEPQALLLFNGGVKLALTDSNTLTDIQTLAERGTRVLVCGTCLNYYEASHMLGAGEIGNMYDLVREMTAAQSVITL